MQRANNEEPIQDILEKYEILELCYGEHYKKYKSIDVSPHSKSPKRPVIMIYIYTINTADIYTLYPDRISTLHIVYVPSRSFNDVSHYYHL